MAPLQKPVRCAANRGHHKWRPYKNLLGAQRIEVTINGDPTYWVRSDAHHRDLG
jgi:hypothetical protein